MRRRSSPSNRICRTLSMLISVLLILGSMPCMMAIAENTYTINEHTVYATKVDDPGDGQCWEYANRIYEIIWGPRFTSDFTGSSSSGYNMLRNLGDSDRTLTADHLKAFIDQAALGAVIRICGCTSGCSHWGVDNLKCGHDGHSLVVVAKSSNGFTTLDRWTGEGRREITWTWDSFYNSLHSKYPYIKYIKWPGAIEYKDNQFLADPILYNAKYYKERYPDLLSAFGNDDSALLHHWMTCGLNQDEGRSASPVFDAVWYIQHNDDVNTVYKGKYIGAAEHFIKFGVDEGRQGSPEFNLQYYKANYLDLQTSFGNDNYKYYWHYVVAGRDENRIANKHISISFDANGGSTPINSKEVVHGAEIGDLPKPTKDGCQFLGWYTDRYKGMLVTSTTIVDYHSFPSLYAHWQQNRVMQSPDFVLPASLKIIDEEAFAGASMTVVQCPEGLEEIHACAFENCTGLKEIYIPDSVYLIDGGAFSGCPSDLTIFGHKGSVAEAHASHNGINFVAVDN